MRCRTGELLSLLEIAVGNSIWAASFVCSDGRSSDDHCHINPLEKQTEHSVSRPVPIQNNADGRIAAAILNTSRTIETRSRPLNPICLRCHAARESRRIGTNPLQLHRSGFHRLTFAGPVRHRVLLRECIGQLSQRRSSCSQTVHESTCGFACSLDPNRHCHWLRQRSMTYKNCTVSRGELKIRRFQNMIRNERCLC